jgi:prophage maintenance system killer protein
VRQRLLMVAVTFLELNGMVFTATEESVVEHTLGLASGDIKEPKYAA